MVAAIYADGDLMIIGWAASAVGAGINLGEACAGTVTEAIGKTKYQVMFMQIFGSTLLAGKFCI